MRVKSQFQISDYLNKMNVFEESHIGLVVTKDGVVIKINHSASTYLVRSPEKLVGEKIEHIFSKFGLYDGTPLPKILESIDRSKITEIIIHAPQKSKYKLYRMGIRVVECPDGRLNEFTILPLLPLIPRDEIFVNGLPFWEHLIDILSQPAAIVSLDGKFLAVNAMTLKLIGASDPKSIVGTNVTEIFEPEELTRLTDGIRDISITDRIDTGIYVLKVGSIRKPVEVTSSLLKGFQGEPVAVLSLARDLSKEKEAYIKLAEQERRLRHIFASIPQPAYIFRQLDNGDIILEQTNKTIREITRGTIVEYEGKKIERLFSEDDSIASIVNEVMRTGVQQQKEIIFHHHGKKLNLIVSCSKLGENLVILTTTNVTEIRESQKKAQKSELEKSTILASMSEQVRYYSWPDFKMRWVNHAAAADLGVSRESIVGKFCYELWEQRNSPCDNCPVIEATKKRTRVEDECELKNGRIFHITANPVINNDEILGIVAVARDVTQDRHQRQVLEEVRFRLQLLNDILTHDLSNIYQGVSIGLELMRDNLDDPKTLQKNLNLVTTQVARSIELIRRVQQFSKIDAYPIELTRIDLAQILQKVSEVIDNMFHNIGTKISIKNNITEAVVMADEFIFDMFFNIIHNAVKFSEKKPAVVDIVIDRVASTGDITVTIEDYGPGIQDTMKGKLFVQRTEGSKGGTGIGLTLVKRIMERYKGSIKVEDRVKGNPGEGARFIVTFKKQSEA